MGNELLIAEAKSIQIPPLFDSSNAGEKASSDPESIASSSSQFLPPAHNASYKQYKIARDDQTVQNR